MRRRKKTNLLKIAIVGLSINFASCASKEKINPTADFLPSKIRLSQLDQNSKFHRSEAGYDFTYNRNEFELKIVPITFLNQTEAVQYLYQRRIFLLQQFQDHMEPYYGLVTADRSCIDKAQLTADMISKDKQTVFFKITMPIDKDKNIFDCSKGNSWGQISYTFFNCKRRNVIYDIRITSQIKVDDLESYFECD